MEARVSYLGLDVGTSGCKAAVFDLEGVQLATAYREYPVRHDRDGAAELDAEHVAAACLEVIAEAAAAAAKDPLRAMAISCQGEAFSALDDFGRVLAPAMVSSDSRAAVIAADWSAEFGREHLYHITGHTAHPMFTLFKLLWLRDNRPDVWRQARRFLCFEDLLHARLGVTPRMSWPLAGRTMLFDVTAHAWSAEILDAVGLTPALFAEPAASGACVGTIPHSVATRLGLADDVMVVAGGHDQMCAALGSGSAAPGQAMYATGTVECIAPLFLAPTFSAELMASNLCTYDAALPGIYGTVAFCLTGGNLLQWYRDQFGAAECAEAARGGEAAYELLLRQMPDEPTSLLVLPYFTPSGTPYFDLHTPGVIYGLRLSTLRGEFLRGLLEGVAYEMRVNVDILSHAGVAISEFRATGGGARNRRWNQLKADILGKPMATVSTTEAGCCGAALLAAAAHQNVPAASLAERWVRCEAVFEPNAKRHAFYDEQFARYQRLYQTISKSC
jgi:xylulokinase